MRCPYCFKKCLETESLKTTNSELKQSVCHDCEILFDTLLLDGQIVDMYARKLTLN